MATASQSAHRTPHTITRLTPQLNFTVSHLHPASDSANLYSYECVSALDERRGPLQESDAL